MSAGETGVHHWIPGVAWGEAELRGSHHCNNSICWIMPLLARVPHIYVNHPSYSSQQWWATVSGLWRIVGEAGESSLEATQELHRGTEGAPCGHGGLAQISCINTSICLPPTDGENRASQTILWNTPAPFTFVSWWGERQQISQFCNVPNECS